MGRLRLGILLSGRGSNMAAIADACAAPDYPATVALALSDRADAPGLDLARSRGIDARAIPRPDFADRAGFEAAIDAALGAAGVDLVCLAGFMRVLGADFLGRWPDRVVNIHPSLLPAFPGLDTHARAIAAGVRLAGCTVHLVRPAVDGGPILAQAAVPVDAADSPETLAARVLAAEHALYPRVVRWLAEGRVTMERERVAIAGTTRSAGVLASPCEMPSPARAKPA
jgi:phosphoribosylglycinamide formyltransferase-1